MADKFTPKIELLNMDCMEYLKGCEDNMFDVVVTSPPYNLNKRASGGGNAKLKLDYENWYFDDLPEQEYQEWQKSVVRELIRVTKGSVFYNHRVRYAWHSRNKYRVPSNIYHPIHWLSEFPIWSEIIWDRGGTSGHANKRCRLADERIYQIGKPHKFNDMGYRTVWNIAPSKNEGHVCSFPNELVERCVLMSTDKGDIVFDPFMGSGTTGVVAEKLARGFVGIEKNEKFYQLAKENLRASTGNE